MMTLDRYIGTKPPAHWQPSKGKIPESKCWFNDEVVRTFGPGASCADPSKKYTYCDGECKWGPHCSKCGRARLWSTGSCVGQTLICVNPECPNDK